MSWLVWSGVILIFGGAKYRLVLKAISVDFRHTLLMRTSSILPTNASLLPTLLMGLPLALPPMPNTTPTALVKPYGFSGVMVFENSTSAFVRVGSIKVQYSFNWFAGSPLVGVIPV